MFTIPGFDPKQFTDEQIIKKMADLSRRLTFANRFSGSYELIAQLQNMMAALEFERRERVARHLFDVRNAMFPEIIETEPDLRIEHESNGERQKEEEAAIRSEDRPRKSKRPQHLATAAERVAPRPTSQPVYRDGADPDAPA